MWRQPAMYEAPGDLLGPGSLNPWQDNFTMSPGTYSPPGAAPQGNGGGPQGTFAKMGGWLGQPAFGTPDSGLLSQTGGGGQPRMNRMSMIGELLSGAASGYMQGLNSGVRGSQWGTAALGATNALKSAKEDEYQKQRQEVLDRVAVLNATKKTGGGPHVIPPGAVMLDEAGKPIFSNPKADAPPKVTDDIALATALSDPKTSPETRKFLLGIYNDKTRPPQAPATPQEHIPEVIATAKYLYPNDPGAQHSWIEGQKAPKETKPSADIAMAAALADPNTSPEEKAVLQQMLDAKTRAPQVPTPAKEHTPEIIATAQYLHPDDPAAQRQWIEEQKKPKGDKPTPDIALAQALGDPNTPPEVRKYLEGIYGDKTRAPQAPTPAAPHVPEVVATAEHLYPNDPDAQRKWIEEQKRKTPATKYVKMGDGSYVPVPTEGNASIPARPGPAELSPTEIKLKSTTEESIAAGSQGLDDLKNMAQISGKITGGPLTNITKYGTMLTNPDQFNSIQEYTNLATNQALGSLRAIFGAQPTEGERQILLDVSGSPNQPPAVRAKIIERATKLASDRLKMHHKQLDELNSGTYGKPNQTKTRVYNPATGRLE